ncbi:efflux RND transporter permease subunit [Desulforegula conservatrix]|uniref:efflux RND transporter permease subunit n=1 Tax=Desulforegula conservatrix TaxID=153026 RepID=UPI0003F685F7|nr:multidrug efflux RND transporter permease subunit [Desulforegula conservatrix]
MSKFFINRPIVAMVIAILTVMIGVITLEKLPIEQYPQLAPPVVRVEANYPGANAESVEESVATPIEQKINGVENMIYMKSSNTGDGRMLLDVSYSVGTNLDNANMLTQNRTTQAEARLAQEVVQQGVTVSKMNPSILMLVSLYSPDSTRDALFLNNYTMINIRDALLRIQGVSDATLFGGSEYGMRIWIRPDTLKNFGLTTTDIMTAVKEQNAQAPAGQIGAAPSKPDQEFTYTVNAPGRLTTAEEFENIIIKSTDSGAQIRLKDVARVELGGENYKAFSRLDGKAASVLALYLLPGANQLQTANGVYKALEDMKKFFPAGVDYKIVYDTTPAITESLKEIVKTLYEAIILVIIVVFVFLQSWRATLIPILTIPVSLVGTFIFFPLFGFSINTLTMFGLILAIGIVVDDAIVVVEAVMHHIEHGMQPKEATLKAMEEVSGPVIGIALILTAVFVPVAFIGGLTGRLYQQFALTIAISVLLSAFSALTLSPALSALLLKPHTGASKGLLGAFFRGFNNIFDRSTKGYVKIAGYMARKTIISLVLLACVLAGSAFFGKALPKGFVPNEDQGIFLVNAQLPNGASIERTDKVMRQIEGILSKTPGVEAANGIGGFGVMTNTFNPNYATFFAKMKPWDERTTKEESLRGILGHLQKEFSKISEAIVFPFIPPTISGFGASGGFNFILQDRSGSLSIDQLGVHTSKFLAEARKRPELANMITPFDPSVPQIKLDLDREKAKKLGVPINDVFTTLQAILGGSYINDFNRFGRLYRVYMQSESDYRQKPDDIKQFYVKSKTTNEMIPLSTLVKITPVSGTALTTRFNLLRSVEIFGAAAPGYTSGQAMAALEEVATAVLPPEMGFTYSGMSYEEKTAPSSVPTFIMAIVFVFLLLAAMYESWSLPFSVLLATPTVVLGSLLGTWLMGLDNNVFVQVGLVMLIGLAAKNSILIVEFAKMKSDEGSSPMEAAMESARLRFRPILMTAFAFLFGVIPLILAKGSGAASRIVMGVAVFSGMLVATILGVYLTPSFFVMMEKLFPKKKKAEETPAVTHGGH